MARLSLAIQHLVVFRGEDMRDVHEMLKEKEQQLAQVQREIEALRLVVKMMGEPEARAAAAAIDPRTIAPAATLDDAQHYMPPSIMRGAATASAYAAPAGTNGGTKRFP